MPRESKKEVKNNSKDLVLASEILHESVVQGKGPKLSYTFRSCKGIDNISWQETDELISPSECREEKMC